MRVRGWHGTVVPDPVPFSLASLVSKHDAIVVDSRMKSNSYLASGYYSKRMVHDSFFTKFKLL
jgi:hypothetical protein